MDRRVAMAVGTAAAVMVLAVLAATSGPVRLWSVPPSDPVVRTVVTAVPTDVATPAPDAPAGEEEARLPTNNVVIQVLAVVLAVLVLMALFSALRLWEGFRLPHWARRARLAPVVALPEVEARALQVDVVAARAALRTGDPRNAIVACWMRLEDDAAAAGLPRAAAETSEEYVARVVAAASVDRGPIGELAALYREARFSRHELHADHRTRAADALERVVAALARHGEAVAASPDPQTAGAGA